MAWYEERDRHSLARKGISTGHKKREKNKAELRKLESTLKMRLAQIRLYKAQEHLLTRGLSRRQLKRIEAESRTLDKRIARDLRRGKLKVITGATGRDQIRPVGKKEILTKPQIKAAHALARRMTKYKDKIKEPFGLATWRIKKKAGLD